MNITLPKKLPHIKITPSWVLWGALVILLLAELFTLRKSIGFVLHAKRDDPGARPVKSIPIMVDGYNTAVARITGAENYEPSSGPSSNPFLPQTSVPENR